MTHRRLYLSYLLRLWQETGEGLPVWRASLESPQSGERRGFADLASLIAFLEEQIGASAEDTAEGRDLSDPSGAAGSQSPAGKNRNAKGGERKGVCR
jgi:hypothetical protein